MLGVTVLATLLAFGKLWVGDKLQPAVSGDKERRRGPRKGILG